MSLLAELAADSEFWGTCPHCGADIQLMDAQLFSVTDELPEIALAQIARLKGALNQRRNELAKAKELMTGRAATTSEGVNIGKVCEKIAPSFASFPFAARDCRCLWEPIDYAVFSGLSANGRVDSITFLEVKTGGARLSQDQRDISAVVEAGKVETRLIEQKEQCDGE